MKVHYFEDLKGYVASFETPQDIVIYTLKEHNAVVCQVAQSKNKVTSKDHALNRLIVTINKLKDRLLKYENIMRENGKAIVSYQNKLQHRNMQIKDLKTGKEKITTQMGYLTEHLLTVEEYHPDYLEDIKNNMI